MDLAITEQALVELLRDGWKDIEELHLITIKMNEAIGKVLMAGFLGARDHGPACPNLQRLYSKYPQLEGKYIDMEEQEKERDELVKRLKNIIDGRKADSRLHHVALGWYPATPDSVMKDKKEAWSVEWSRILYSILVVLICENMNFCVLYLLNTERLLHVPNSYSTGSGWPPLDKYSKGRIAQSTVKMHSM
jgi:hypothetical protein